MVCPFLQNFVFHVTKQSELKFVFTILAVANIVSNMIVSKAIKISYIKYVHNLKKLDVLSIFIKKMVAISTLILIAYIVTFAYLINKFLIPFFIFIKNWHFRYLTLNSICSAIQSFYERNNSEEFPSKSICVQMNVIYISWITVSSIYMCLRVKLLKIHEK